MRSTARALALALAALTAGCDLAPRYARPALPVAAALPDGGPAEAVPIVAADLAWHDFFTDPRLLQLIAIALENNRDLRVSAANVAQARAQYEVQRADLGPTLAGTASATIQKTPEGFSGSTATSSTGTGTGGIGGGTGAGTGTGVVTSGQRRLNIYSAQVGISAWEIDLFGRLRNLGRAAQEQYFASRDAQDATRTALIAELASAFVTMAADQDRLRIARDTLDAFGRTLELNRQRFEGGIASELDVRQAQTSYDQARSDAADGVRIVLQDRNRLNLLAGTTVPGNLLPAGLAPEGSTIPHLPADLASNVLLRRPDIAEAEHRLRAANADIGAARAALFPQISLTAAAGTLSLGLSNLFGGGSGTWSVAPTVSVPIFDFGRNRGNLRYAEATRDAAIGQYERAIQTGFREVADALARRSTIGAQLEAQTSLRAAARQAYVLSNARYRTGIEPFLNTLDAQRTLYAAEQSLVTTRLTAETNLIELYRSLGGGLH